MIKLISRGDPDGQAGRVDLDNYRGKYGQWLSIIWTSQEKGLLQGESGPDPDASEMWAWANRGFGHSR